jgi:peptide/nickel transport system permease protein
MTAVPDITADAPGERAATPRTAGRSLREIVWARLRRDRIAIICAAILIVMYIIAMVGPIVGPWFGLDPYRFDREAISNLGGQPIGPMGGMSLEHPFGVEWGTGRDLFSQMLWGLRTSLFIATTAAILTVTVGTVVGIVAGYVGGWVDMVIGRLTDLTLAFPFLLIVLALSSVLTQRLTQLGVPEGNPSRITYLILVISAFGWPYLARIVRGQVLSLREREFVEASVAMGAGRRRILFTEILPNLWAPILVYTTLLLPSYIGLEAALSFLGVGVIPPDTTFGGILARSVAYFRVVPTYLFIPGGILVLLVVTFNILGDSIRDALDPRAIR